MTLMTLEELNAQRKSGEYDWRAFFEQEFKHVDYKMEPPTIKEMIPHIRTRILDISPTDMLDVVKGGDHATLHMEFYKVSIAHRELFNLIGEAGANTPAHGWLDLSERMKRGTGLALVWYLNKYLEVEWRSVGSIITCRINRSSPKQVKYHNNMNPRA
jgi:hypothetical protein